jgi:3-hydroxy acid dehydrogenase / malonic semialdehyde reductase
MSRLTGRVVFVTGASSGIGLSCARAFAAEGARLLLAARRKSRLDEATADFRARGARDVHALELDVRDAAAVSGAVLALPAAWRDIDVLVANAGLSRGLGALQEGSVEDWNEMIDTNVKGLLHVDRAVVPGMVARRSGTVIHLGSIAGRQVYPGGNVYCATKHAVRALTEALRLDVLGTGVRVATVDPGLVGGTEFSAVRFHGDAGRAEAVYRGMTPLSPEDVADAVVWVATRPPHVVVAELVLLPTDQASSTHVHRKADGS